MLRAVDQWFNEPVEEILSSANQIAADYYRERQQVVTDQAARIAGLLATADLASPDVRAVRAQLTRAVNERRIEHRAGLPRRPHAGRRARGRAAGRRRGAQRAATWPRASADLLASRIATGVDTEPWMLEEITAAVTCCAPRA